MKDAQLGALDTVRCANFLNNDLPEGCADLIVADPPYFEVKGDFDFQWPTFDAYLSDVERWATECARLLAPNGSLIWWGSAARIAYSQIILDRHFRLLANCAWYKKDGVHNKQNPQSLRTFRSATERFLHYESHDAPQCSFSQPNADYFHEPFEPLRLWLRREIDSLGGAQCVAAALHISDRAVCHWTCRSQWTFPRAARVNQLLELYPRPYRAEKAAEFAQKRVEFEGKMRTYHEEAQREHDARLRPFNGTLYNFRDIITATQETHITKHYDFPTKKPPTLTRQLIETCSRPGALVVIPFAGSGTECEAAKVSGRHFIAFDTDPRAAAMAQARAAAANHEPTLPL